VGDTFSDLPSYVSKRSGSRKFQDYQEYEEQGSGGDEGNRERERERERWVIRIISRNAQTFSDTIQLGPLLHMYIGQGWIYAYYDFMHDRLKCRF
jgi:hypothetical protein